LGRRREGKSVIKGLGEIIRAQEVIKRGGLSNGARYLWKKNKRRKKKYIRPSPRLFPDVVEKNSILGQIATNGKILLTYLDRLPGPTGTHKPRRKEDTQIKLKILENLTPGGDMSLQNAAKRKKMRHKEGGYGKGP